MKLLDQLTVSCRTMNFAPATEECYRAWIEGYLRYHRDRAGAWVHPDRLREATVEDYLSHLAVVRNLSASSQSPAMCALVFFYRAVQQAPLERIAAFLAQRPERLPVVLSADEVRGVLLLVRVPPRPHRVTVGDHEGFWHPLCRPAPYRE